MRKLLYGVAGLIVIVIIGLLVGPSFFDWNSYKPQIATAVKDALGRELRIVGDINLSILPSPALSVQRVSLENVEGADNREMVAFDEVEVNVDVSALLQGKIAVKSVRLVRPVIALEITKEGQASWDIKLPGSSPDAGASPSSTDAGSSGSSGFTVDVSLDSLQIENATITYRDARSGLSERIEGLTTNIAADSLSGPFRAEGSATARNIPFSFALNAGRLDANRPLPVNLEIGIAETQADIRFTGKLSDLTPDATLSGNVKATASDLANLAQKLAGAKLPSALKETLDLNAEVNASATVLGVNKLTIRLGETSFAGALHGLLKPTLEMDLVLSSTNVDVDKLLSYAARDGITETDKTATAASVETKIATSPQPKADDLAFKLPEDIVATFDLGVETASYNGGIIRDAALKGALRDGVVTLERLGATLPGSSAFSVSGTLKPAENLPQFSGAVAATSDNLRRVIQWLGVAPGSLPADRLRNFSYTSQLSANPKGAEVTDIQIQIDATRINGGLAVELRDKPGIGLRLDVDKLNLDAYLPKPPRTSKAAASASGTTAKATPKEKTATTTTTNAVATGLSQLLDALDANIQISAGQISLRGETARNAKLDLTIFDDKVTIQEASVADFAGIGASLAGTLSNENAKPSLNVDYAVIVRDTGRGARFLGMDLPMPAARLGKLTSKGRIDATLDRVRTVIRLSTMGVNANVKGSIGDLLTDPRLNFDIDIRHPELTTLIRKFAPTYRPAAKKLGPLKADLTIGGTQKAISVSKINIQAGPVNTVGTAKALQSADRTTIDLDLKTSEILLDLFLPPEPKASAGNSQRRRGGSGATSSTSRRTSAAKRWSSAPMNLSLPTNLDANATLRVAALTKDKISLKNAKMRAVLKSGNLSVEQLEATLFGGKIEGRAAVQPGKTKTAVAAELILSNLDSRTAVKTISGHDRIKGPLSLNANLATTGNSEVTFVSALNGKISLKGQAQVLLSKSERNQISVATVGGNLLSSLFGGKVRELQNLAPFTKLLASLDQAFGRNPAQLSGDLRIKNGVAQTNNLALTGQGNTATTRATIDLPRWQLSSITELIDDPKQEPLVTFEAVGPIDAPSRTKVGGRLLRQGSTAVEEKAKNPLQQIIPGLLGGSSGSSDSQEQKKVNPGKLLEGIFKQLQR